MIARRVPLRRSAPPRRGEAPKRRVPVRKRRGRPRRGPQRCADYLAWIRTLRCVVCSRVGGGSLVIEAAHTNTLGMRGLGQKSSGFSAVPLCRVHHRDGPESYHRLGERRFVERHRIDLAQLVDSLNHLFRGRVESPPLRGGRISVPPESLMPVPIHDTLKAVI